MKLRIVLCALACLCALLVAGCGGGSGNTNSGAAAEPGPPKAPVALPDNGFKAQITLADPPTKLRAGQKVTVQVKIKNASTEIWWARGGPVNTRSDNMFYIATGNRWLKSDGSKLTDMDGRYGIGKDLNPGEETQVPLLITAPAQPGEYILEVDMVQEQVAWFSDKGSPTARTNITVVK